MTSPPPLPVGYRWDTAPRHRSIPSASSMRHVVKTGSPRSACGIVLFPSGSWRKAGLTVPACPACVQAVAPPPAAATLLTAREAQVMNLVAEGRENIEIGALLGVSPLTVKSHLARITRRLGVGTRAGLTALLMRSGDIHPRLHTPDFSRLTEREWQVLRGICEGKENGEIGAGLFLSEDTVKTHARRLFARIGAVSRAHAVALAVVYARDQAQETGSQEAV